VGLTSALEKWQRQVWGFWVQGSLAGVFGLNEVALENWSAGLIVAASGTARAPSI
jgi:hypothetical protein